MRLQVLSDDLARLPGAGAGESCRDVVEDILGPLRQLAPRVAGHMPPCSGDAVLALAVALEPVGLGVERKTIDLYRKPFPLERHIHHAHEAFIVVDGHVRRPPADPGLAQERGQPALGLGPLAASDEIPHPGQPQVTARAASQLHPRVKVAND